MPKYCQMVNPRMYKRLEREARRRDISVTELIRAVILPEYFKVKSRPVQEIGLSTQQSNEKP